LVKRGFDVIIHSFLWYFCLQKTYSHWSIPTYINSFSPWSRKVAWIRALVHRAYKTCNTEDLLKDELQHIKNFLSWNGFPRKLSLKLIDQFKPSTTSDLTDLTNPRPVPKIWLPLPYLGKYGTRLTRSFIHRITEMQFHH
jgi:hypothetical protein